MKKQIRTCFILFCIFIFVKSFTLPVDPAINNDIGYYDQSVFIETAHVKSSITRDSIPPTFSISHTENGDVTIHVISDEDLFVGWVDEKEIWSVTNFDYWWLNTRISRDSQNDIYAAVKLYEYSDPNSNFDMYKLYNNGDIFEESNNWNGPGGNPLIVNYPSENIYIGNPTLDPEGAIDSNNITYVFSGSGSISFTKIDSDGTLLISGQTIITGANAWTNEIRVAIDTNDRIYLAWSKDMHDITYAYSDDGGTNWSEQISLCYNAADQLNKPQICCDNNDNVHIVWQHWTGASNLLSYMKLGADGTVTIDESFLTQSNNQVWAAQMDIDEENNLHIVWARSSQQITSAYYTKINGNLDGNGLSLTDDELTLVPENTFIINETFRYPKCVVDDYENVHTIYERGQYGCNHPKSVYYKKMNSAPLLRIECPNDSVLFMELTGSGTVWEGTFTPPGSGTYDVRISGSDSSGNTGVNFYQFEYIGVGVQDDELLSNKVMLSNYPNPFNPSTTIKFTTIERSPAFDGNTEKNTETCPPWRIVIYNVKGEKVRELPIVTPSLSHTLSVTWNGTDDNSKPVSSGIYFYKLEAGDFQKVKKMILLR
jgi:hypothetical protein